MAQIQVFFLLQGTAAAGAGTALAGGGTAVAGGIST